MRSRGALLPLIGAMLALSIACVSRSPSSPELRTLLSADTPPRDIPERVWRDAQRFYAARDFALAWIHTPLKEEQAPVALSVLARARDHGLDPAHYAMAALRTRYHALAALDDEDASLTRGVADLDVRLTAALLQLGHDVAVGRLEPSVIDARWNRRRDPPDLVGALQHANPENPVAFLEAVRPQHPEYAALQESLTGLRAQEENGWPAVPGAARALKQGASEARVVPVLRARLAAQGYLPAGASRNAAAFDTDVSQAVRAFQEHHGLKPTGVLDAVTLAKMNVPLAERIAQVAINLERWRWLPDDLGARHVIVNVPYFHLIAREQGSPVLDIRVVVGKRGNETPLFSDAMETVVFSPYWNIPETIALEETAPALAKDSDYLARNNMEIVDASGNVVSPDTLDWGDEALLSAYRFRQRPGPGNALGHVKFLFPNEHAVYLHDTPADALFARIGRAFSHGCVRVEEPETLAKYVLREQPEWTADRIQAAMRAGTERAVALTTPIPVHIVYFTAWVDVNGGLHFQDDVYGYDQRQARTR